MAQTSRNEPSELMIVNDVPGDECRIAILEDGHLEELYAERVQTATNVGNIYKGRVINVEPAIQAAFIDYGRGINGFLHISDLHPRYFPGGDRTERVGKKTPRRERPSIQEALRRGDEIIVQVLKEGIGTKGPTLTSYVSLPGRLLVLMPEMDKVGVSRKIEDDQIRREMRKTLDTIELPEGFGFILRTAGIGKPKTELKRDIAYLQRLWKLIDDRIRKVGAPCPLYTESDLLIRTVRDVMRPSLRAIIVDSESAYNRLTAFLRVIAPRSAPPVVRYRRRAPIFHAFDIERQIELIHSREVPLPSGGALVIEQTEALVAIDVNSGRSRSARDSETNAYRTNCEAVDEICRQLRLRDLGGLLVFDLIDMRSGKHRKAIEDRMREHFKSDRARTTIGRISEFGLLEMTRQRMRPSLRKSYFIPCQTCAGRGEVRAPETLAAEITRHLGYLLDQARVHRVEAVCSPRVASLLLSRKRRELVDIEESSGKRVDIRVSEDIEAGRVDFYAYDERNADIEVAALAPGRAPSVDDLIRDADRPELDEEADVPAAAGGGRRRRRRRRRGPADATEIAISGSFLEGIEGLDDEEDLEDEDAGPEVEAREAAGADGPGAATPTESGLKKGRRRRRRRRRGGADAPDTVSVPADDIDAAPPETVEAVPVPVFSEDTRVHQIAKHLGVASRDVLERCGENGIEARGHMSRLSADDANLVVRLYPPVPTATVVPHEDGPATTMDGAVDRALSISVPDARRAGAIDDDGTEDDVADERRDADHDGDTDETDRDMPSSGGGAPGVEPGERKRRRRRRGGRRNRRGRGEAPSGDSEDDVRSTTGPDQPEPAVIVAGTPGAEPPSIEADGGASRGGKKRRRRGRGKDGAAKPATPAVAAAQPPGPGASRETSEPTGERLAARRKRGGRKVKGGGDAAAAKPASAAGGAGTAPASAPEPAAKRRRTLYGGARRSVPAGAARGSGGGDDGE